MRRLPHRSFGLFRGWTGSCQARGQEGPLGGPRHSPRVTFSQKNGLGEQPCMEMPELHHGIAIPPVYTVLDVGLMIAIDCGAMEMGIVENGAVCYQCMRASPFSVVSFVLSPELLRPFRPTKRASPVCLHFLAFFHAPSLARSRLRRGASGSRHILF